MENVRDVADNLQADELFPELTREYGQSIQQRLIDGLHGGYDIEGKTFKGLKESTLNIRRSRKISGDDILIARDGAIQGFLEGDDLIETGKVQVKLNKPPHEYMTHQNEGFVTGGFLPGKSVPPRKWYGIPKSYREGGTKYNEFLKAFVKRIEGRFAKALKFS